MPESKPFRIYAQKTIKLLEDEGWCKGQYGPCAHVNVGSGHGPHCLLGAIGELHVTYDQEMDFVEAIGRQLPPLPPSYNSRGTLVVWNDDPKRTKEQVIELLQQLV